MSDADRVARREQAFERFSKLVDGPLMFLALAMVPLLLVPLVVELSPAAERIVVSLDYLIWAIFAVEYFVKLYLSPNRRQFVRRNVPDLVIVVLPILRPLRILRSARLLRLLRLARVAAFAIEGLGEVRAILRRRGLNYVLLLVLAVMILASVLVAEFERDADGNIKTFTDAMWWAATTVTTVGYGDRFPVTAGGRGVAFALMITGIALFGVLTAAIAAYFVEHGHEDDGPDVRDHLEEISNRLAAIESRLPLTDER